jgi:type IV pilus assembly protein PilM
MALPSFKGFARKRDRIVVIDLGSKVTKAVEMSRKGDIYSLHHFAMVDVPGENPVRYPDVLADHFKTVMNALGSKHKKICVAIGVADSLLRHAEMPVVPVHDMRSMLKFSSKNYLQQDLSDYTFDCHILPHRAGGDDPKRGVKVRVLVGAAKRKLVDDIQDAAKKAGLSAVHVVPNFIGPANAFELVAPEDFKAEPFALVEIGQKDTTISVISDGELALSRVVSFGAEKLTQGIAEAMGIDEEEAEGAKVTMPPELEAYLAAMVNPLGRELRASVDFFDHQHDRPVSKAFFSGGSARSARIVEALQTELMIPCHQWNPAQTLQLQLPPHQLGEVEDVAPQLAVAIGAGIAAID